MDSLKQTDSILYRTEREIRSQYKKLAKRIQKKSDTYLSKYADKDEEMMELLETGQITEDDLKTWRRMTYMTGSDWDDFREDVAEDCTRTNKDSLRTAMHIAGTVYALNRMGVFDEVKSQIRKEEPEWYSQNKGLLAITERDAKREYNRAASGQMHLLRLPSPEVKTTKDYLWNSRKIYDAVNRGITKGMSIPQMANEISRVANVLEPNAIRAARTLTTGIQNISRIETMRELVDMGFDVRKIWVATLDDRTRESHRDLDGEEQEVEDLFTNGLLFPGDPTGDAEEIANCRCTLACNVLGMMESINPEDVDRRSKIGDYDEWKHGKS